MFTTIVGAREGDEMNAREWLQNRTETKAASALRLLSQLRTQIESGDYSLAQDTCETVYHLIESAKLACNNLADMPDVAMIQMGARQKATGKTGTP